MAILAWNIPLANAAQVSPLANLADAEKTYYIKIFDYSMDNVKPGSKYDWASYGGKGSISIGDPFISKSGANCRHFSESFNVHGEDGADRGIGCKRRGKEGWCKLDLKKAQTCSFEDPGFMFGVSNLSVPGVNTPTLGGIDSGSGNSNANANSNSNSNIDTSIDTHRAHAPKDVTAKSYSESVTGGAGKAAGNAAGSGVSWFTSTFLR